MKASILLVEDEEDDVYLLKQAFAEAGITNDLHVVRTGSEAMDFFSGAGRFGDRKVYRVPGLVLLDLNLPGISGLEVLEWMKTQDGLKIVAVIVFTASCHPIDIERAYELGANCFVTKPQTLEGLVQMAQHLKAWWLGFAQLAPVVDQASIVNPTSTTPD